VIAEERRKYLSRHDAKSVHHEIASIHEPIELSSFTAATNVASEPHPEKED